MSISEETIKEIKAINLPKINFSKIFKSEEYKKLVIEEKETMLKDMPKCCMVMDEFFKANGMEDFPASLHPMFMYWYKHMFRTHHSTNEYIGVHYYFSLSGLLEEFSEWYTENWDEDEDNCTPKKLMFIMKSNLMFVLGNSPFKIPEFSDEEVMKIIAYFKTLKYKVWLSCEER